jgi:uncharacterized membrane protein YuzA (DUF378 family)
MQFPFEQVEPQGSQERRFVIEDVNHAAKVMIPEGQKPPERSSAAWDPYEVWHTRVRVTPKGGDVRGPMPEGAIRHQNMRTAFDMQKVVRAGKAVEAGERTAAAFFWTALILVVILGLNRELMGIFRFDLVEVVLGDMTPAARVVQVVLGLSAMYCALITVMFAKHRIHQ